jgi:hypothetical protein
MKLTRQTLSNIAIAAVAFLLFAGFVALATKGGGKNNDKLSAVAPTTTTRRVTTTTEEVTTTSTSFVADTTTTAAPVATTSTTRAATTPTTKKPTTTTSEFTCPARGAQSSANTDNQASFTHNNDGSVNSNATTPNNTDSILFTISATPVGNPEGANENVQFTVVMENKSTNHCIYFADAGDNANFYVLLTPSGGGAPIQFTVPAGAQSPLKPGEKLTAKQTNVVSGYGTFIATATCNVNYS